ncbi:putative ATP-binding cassette transporter/putative ATP-binding cassette transporter [Chitinophaga polysaccharea]|uniref:Putative ATP-binding cassette transporter/putative ATP-binding cassette transporter n=1 Tax=Chitinophaga polysaccharea TaxID=1293035 RepID=A0A561PRB4_9BACT|nr:cyclic peptide export ABC transporter [Chitinophaga polysaccharea]TWF40666.1 putative ATP-binding cassette transporter/putative ATP-binding cassette transporter [Chitinophaga polysaccharea]
MRLISLLQKKSKLFYILLLLLGLINSIWSMGLLLLINNRIAGTSLPFVQGYDWQIYVVLILVSFFTARAFQSYTIRLTYELGNDLGLSVFEKLRFADYEEYIKLGEEKVRTATADVTTLQRFPNVFIETFNAIVMVTIGLGYLFYTNFFGALLILGVLSTLAVVYYIRNLSISRDLNTVRDLANVYQQNVNDFLRGFKDVKMSITRSNNIFIRYISQNRHRVKELTIKTLIKFMGNELMGNYLWYLLIGIIIFLLPVILHMTNVVNNQFVVTLLYLMGPVGIVVARISEFTQMQIAVDRLEQFHDKINASKAIAIGHGDLAATGGKFESIRFKEVTFEYYDERRAETFRLKPLTLDIKKGESIFITGGNGSGKSTFVNLLTGLYVPHTGTIALNGQVITESTYPGYRNRIAAIFTDSILFNENYDGLDLAPDNERLMFWLRKMELENIVTFDNEKKSIKADLSKGQQKRLALIYIMLEDKDVIVLDEWAAEQDPVFRAYFYKKIIPELKQMGKTVIVVTHDDTYFHCGERLIKFDYGNIVSDTSINAASDLHYAL